MSSWLTVFADIYIAIFNWPLQWRRRSVKQHKLAYAIRRVIKVVVDDFAGLFGEQRDAIINIAANVHLLRWRHGLVIEIAFLPLGVPLSEAAILIQNYLCALERWCRWLLTCIRQSLSPEWAPSFATHSSGRSLCWEGNWVGFFSVTTCKTFLHRRKGRSHLEVRFGMLGSWNGSWRFGVTCLQLVTHSTGENPSSQLNSPIGRGFRTALPGTDFRNRLLLCTSSVTTVSL